MKSKEEPKAKRPKVDEVAKEEEQDDDEERLPPLIRPWNATTTVTPTWSSLPSAVVRFVNGKERYSWIFERCVNVA